MAELLNTSITNIPTTNNHLESFNSHFKDTYIKQFQRGGSQVRVNTLCISLISFITPNLIRKRNLQQKFDEELQSRKSHFGILQYKLITNNMLILRKMKLKIMLQKEYFLLEEFKNMSIQ